MRKVRKYWEKQDLLKSASSQNKKAKSSAGCQRDNADSNMIILN